VIRSKKEYEEYVAADKNARGFIKPITLAEKIKNRFSSDISKYVELLRKAEYHNNCSKNPATRFYALYLKYRLYKTGLKLGFTIPLNCFGPGLYIPHIGTIVVQPNSRIGANCILNIDVVIGQNYGDPKKVPSIGNNVFIGPGAKLFGKITIADNIVVGANSVVNKSFLESGISIGGVPAKKISNNGIKCLVRNE
jgi:serine O-acetyltransferase